MGLDHPVDPATSCPVADVLLLVVAGAHRVEDLVVRRLVDLFALALAAALLDHRQHARRLRAPMTAHLLPGQAKLRKGSNARPHIA